MVAPVSSNINSYVTPLAPAKSEVPSDPLADHRMAQSRQLALDASRQQHSLKVQAAIEAFMNFEAQKSAQPTTTVEAANQTYGEF